MVLSELEVAFPSEQGAIQLRKIGPRPRKFLPRYISKDFRGRIQLRNREHLSEITFHYQRLP